jgi:hypothetical protein
MDNANARCGVLIDSSQGYFCLFTIILSALGMEGDLFN